jgi:hypothetical protein
MDRLPLGAIEGLRIHSLSSYRTLTPQA